MTKRPPQIEVTPTTVTSVTKTTTVTSYIHPGGGVNGSIVFEPIGSFMYLYSNGRSRGIKKTEYNQDLKRYQIEIEGKAYNLNGKPIKAPYFRVPSKEIINKWIAGDYKPKDIKEIFNELVDFFETAFDFVDKKTPVIIALRTLITWFRDFLGAFFYFAIDATMGAGKTSLLYAMSLLSKHGAMGGDISTSFLARAVDRYKLCLHIDELDENSKERKAELEGILRKGQRKGNPYFRINANTMEPESFEVHGPHAFSFRTTIEDALRSRTLPGRLRVSNDKALPVLNYHIDTLTEDLFNDLFFYYMEHASDFASYGSYEVTEVTQLREGSLGDLQGKSVSEKRERLFKSFTKGFTDKELELMGNLMGRNIELSYICLQVAHYLKLDIFDAIKEALVSKQNEESMPDSFYLDKLKDYLRDLILRKSEEWTLTKGEHEGCFYYPKTLLFSEFVASLKKDDIPTIGNSKFNGLLKDIGFVEGINWRAQKDKDDRSVRCLIVDSEIDKSLKGVTP